MLHDLAGRGLRTLEPETAHRLTLRALAAGLGPVDAGPDDPALALKMAGLDLPNCIGLAAGFDKDAQAHGAMLRAGFGFVECGSVTPEPQDGNPRPRLFRLAKDRGVINRMGFNNGGLEAFAERLAAPRRRGVVGANLGANKDSADRIGDYVRGLDRLWGLADYFTINVSSPNTPGLRDLQSRTALEELCGRLSEVRARKPGKTPLFLKVAPELNERAIADIVDVATRACVNGLIIANTTTERPGTLASASRVESGGLSGKPLFETSTRTLKLFHQAHDEKLALIGAGGVSGGAEAYAKIRAGACAVQLYTALIFEGPGVVRRIKRDLLKRLRADGFTSVHEARGTA